MNIEELLYNDMLAISSFKLALVALISAHLLKHHGWSADVMGAGPSHGIH